MSDVETKWGMEMRWHDEETKAFFRLMMNGLRGAMKDAIHEAQNVRSVAGTKAQVQEVEERAGMVRRFMETARDEWEREESSDTVRMGWKAWNLLFYGIKKGIEREIEDGFWKVTGGEFKAGAEELREIAQDLVYAAKLIGRMEKGGEA